MRLTACVFAAVLAAGPARADEPTARQVLKEMFARSKEAVELLDGIKDAVAAEKAKPRLEKLSKQILEGGEELKKRPKADVEAAYRAQNQELPSLADAYERLMRRSAAAAEVLDDVSLLRKNISAKEGLAEINAETLIKAVKTYQTQNNRWPAQLTDVADFLENGVLAILDPWGQPYKYEIGPTIDPKSLIRGEPYVWAERKVGEKVKVIGTKPVKKQ